MSSAFGGVISVTLYRSVAFITRFRCGKFLLSQTCETMKLYSDRGNLFLLRIVAAKNLARVPLTIEYITYEGTGKMFLFTVGLKAKLRIVVNSFAET